MATNPMQRKARNSILMGIIIGLLIGSVFIVILFLQLTKAQKTVKDTQEATKQVYVAKSDIKSGTKLDSNMFELKSAVKDVIPADYITVANLTEETIAKVDISKGSVISKSLVNESSEKTTNDLREQQYNMVILPQYLDIDNYIDIRITLPDGTDYIVVSKKRIKNITEDTIWIDMYEDETLLMSNAIVENYIMTGSKLYATIYVEPGLQTTATPTYTPSGSVTAAINADTNIREEARIAIKARQEANGNAMGNQRNNIQNQLNRYSEEGKDNLESSMEQETIKSIESRKAYVDSLNASY